jgi:hypothetical protein
MRSFASRRALLAAVAASVVLASTAHAAPPGFAFLDIPTGVRAAGLGGAYASLAEGAEAMYWNPAGLEKADGLQIAGGHVEWIEALRHDHFAVAGRAFGGGLGASVRALYSEPIEERDDFGNLVGSFGAHDLEFALAYGHSIGSGLSIGGNAALVRERIANLAAQTYAFGFGGSWQPEGSGVRVAAAAQNLGPSAAYTIDGVKGEPVALPAALQGGVSYGAGLGSRWHVRGVVESRVARGRNAVAAIGTELSELSGGALRAGMRFNDSATVLSFGAGYAWPAFHLDYAFVPLRYDAGDTHRFGFSARF